MSLQIKQVGKHRQDLLCRAVSAAASGEITQTEKALPFAFQNWGVGEIGAMGRRRERSRRRRVLTRKRQAAKCSAVCPCCSPG